MKIQKMGGNFENQQIFPKTKACDETFFSLQNNWQTVCKGNCVTNQF